MLGVGLTLTLKTLTFVCLNQETKGFFQFEIFINVLVRSFRFICIPKLWVDDHSKHDKYCNSFIATVFIFSSFRLFIGPSLFVRI